MSDAATTARRKAKTKAKKTKVCGNCDWFDDRTLFCRWDDPTVVLPAWVRLDKYQRYVSPSYGAGKCRAWVARRELAVAADLATQNNKAQETP